MKIGEHLSVVSAAENKFSAAGTACCAPTEYFFRGEEPGKDLHFFTAMVFGHDCSDKWSKKPQKTADR